MINKTIELALGGDPSALRLCIERLIPKIQRQPLSIDLPNDLRQTELPELAEKVLRAVFDGEITVADAEKLIKLLNDQKEKKTVPLSLSTIDPVEASRIYQQIMMGN